MAAILSSWAMLNHRRLRRGCLIEFLYPTGRRTFTYPTDPQTAGRNRVFAPHRWRDRVGSVRAELRHQRMIGPCGMSSAPNSSAGSTSLNIWSICPSSVPGV